MHTRLLFPIPASEPACFLACLLACLLPLILNAQMNSEYILAESPPPTRPLPRLPRLPPKSNSPLNALFPKTKPG